jgi:hypothetical protein
VPDPRFWPLGNLPSPLISEVKLIIVTEKPATPEQKPKFLTYQQLIRGWWLAMVTKDAAGVLMS